MFDIGFWELAIIGVVALLVLGPERLPGAARTAGLWIRKARETLSSVQHEIERELAQQELRKVIDQDTIDELEEFRDDVNDLTKFDEVTSLKNEATQQIDEIRNIASPTLEPPQENRIENGDDDQAKKHQS